MSTIKEIAKACNVSIATVSNILNDKPGASEKTRKLVLETVERLDYVPNIVAKNLKLQKTRCIGVIAEDLTIFSIPDIIDGITEYFENVDYHILLTNLRLFKKFSDTYYHQESYFEFVRKEIKKLLQKQVEGIIYVAAHERVIRCIPNELSVPAVMAYGYSKNARVPSVVVNDAKGAYELTEHLIKNGHKKIGMITGKDDSMHVQDRLVGYQKALYDYGILYNPAFVVSGDWTRGSGRAGAKKLMREDVTAIFCMNDLMAGGVYDLLEEYGVVVGSGVSVVGYDNRELSGYYHPPLTTMDLPLHDIGYRSGEVMINMLDGKGAASEERVYAVDCKMLLRQSVRQAGFATGEGSG